MTYAQMVQFLKVCLDEIGGVAVFYNDPADYDDALSEGQRGVLMELIGLNEVERYRALVVRESIADGGTLTHHCVRPESVYDAANGLTANLRSEADFNTYFNVTTPDFEQAYVANDTLHTQPGGGTYEIVYIREPAAIGSGQTSELSPVVHELVCLHALQILLHKDIDASGLEMIEAYRNKLEVYKAGKKPPEQTAQGFQPVDIPYSQR
ncbi:MAG: hypothetical protein KGJ13_02150 [Patescibacteria group bacterium]|nr:hypothetical protein [Patescibacteria group bacterium]